MLKIHKVDSDKEKRLAKEIYRARPLDLIEVSKEESKRILNKLKSFYQTHLEKSGLDGYVIGLSGGIDSSLVTKILQEAIGSDSVFPVLLPRRNTDQENIQDALNLANSLNLEINDYEEFRENINSIVLSLEDLGHPVSDSQTQKIKRGNILARVRMIILRDIAKANKCLLAGTTNASEKLLGYLTLAADGNGGIDNEGLYNIFKTTEFDLAKEINIPEDIIEKDPSADLWSDQTDKKELGSDYETIDQILVGYKLGFDSEQISEVTGIRREIVESILNRVKRNSYKRREAPNPSF